MEQLEIKIKPLLPSSTKEQISSVRTEISLGYKTSAQSYKDAAERASYSASVHELNNDPLKYLISLQRSLKFYRKALKNLELYLDTLDYKPESEKVQEALEEIKELKNSINNISETLGEYKS